MQKLSNIFPLGKIFDVTFLLRSTILASNKLLMGNTAMHFSNILCAVIKPLMLLVLDFSTILVSNKLLVRNTSVMHCSEVYVLLFNNNTIASHKHEAMKKQQSMKKDRLLPSSGSSNLNQGHK